MIISYAHVIKKKKVINVIKYPVRELCFLYRRSRLPPPEGITTVNFCGLEDEDEVPCPLLAYGTALIPGKFFLRSPNKALCTDAISVGSRTLSSSRPRLEDCAGNLILGPSDCFLKVKGRYFN